MLSAQQVIGEIQAAEYIEATACKTDGGKGVVVHPVIVAVSLWLLHSGARCRWDGMGAHFHIGVLPMPTYIIHPIASFCRFGVIS